MRQAWTFHKKRFARNNQYRKSIEKIAVDTTIGGWFVILYTALVTQQYLTAFLIWLAIRLVRLLVAGYVIWRLYQQELHGYTKYK